MKALGLVVVAVVAAITACTHTTYVSPPDLEACARLTGKLAHHEALVTLVDGTQFAAKGLLVSPDSTSWLNSRTAELTTTATQDILEIRVTSRGKGAAEGLATGVLVGMAGGAICFTMGDDPPGLLSFSAEQKALVGLTVVGVPGVLVGTLAGAATGSKDIYRFDAPPPWEN